jgi:poly(3-hydroxybutyrate) depolymerase
VRLMKRVRLLASALVSLVAALASRPAVAQGLALPVDHVIPAVACLNNPAQGYALYLPPGYTPTRAWPVIYAFDAGGRGLTPVERYRAAAAQYGFIIAGSNNSRNRSTEWPQAVQAMSADVATRFNVDGRRIYLAGMSGGSRVALSVALSSPDIAGVVASSAGYPDSVPRKSLPFVLFGTAGTEDFNHLEMRLLDRELTTPHHLSIFQGGHTWLSSDLAIEAVEWLEIQAMRAGIKPKDPREIDLIFDKRTAHLSLTATDAATFLALQAVGEDFAGLKDTSAYVARATTLAREKSVKDALKRARDEDDREIETLNDIRADQARLANTEERPDALLELNQLFKSLGDKARKPSDSDERRFARRVLGEVSSSGPAPDPEFQKILSKYRMTRAPGN